MTARKKIGLIGCGAWGKNILRDLVSIGSEVSVVIRRAREQAYARENGAKEVFFSIDELPLMDGFVVATPTATHGPVVLELLKTEVPIFVEKPLTDDVASARQIAEQGRDRVFVMEKWRYHRGVRMLAEIARSGELGPVIGLHTTRIGWGNSHHDVDPIWILTPHDLSIAKEILGHIPDPKAASAESTGGHPTGLVGLLGQDPWCHVEVSANSPANVRLVRLHCAEGVASLDGAFSGHISLTRHSDPHDCTPPETEARSFPDEMPLLAELEAFLEFLDGGPPPKSSVDEGLRVVEVISELRALAGLDSES